MAHAPDFDLPPLGDRVAHRTSRLLLLASKALLAANRHIRTDGGAHRADVRLLARDARHMRHPCGRLNFGLVELDPDGRSGGGGGGAPALRLRLYGQRRGRPVCVHRSPPL